MKRAKLQRLLAFVLAFLFIVSSAVTVSAAGENSSVTDKTTSDIKALLNAISYNDYCEDNVDVPNATEEIVIDATEAYTFATKGGEIYNETSQIPEEKKADFAYVDTFDGKKGLYLPGVGTATWTTDKITAAGKYNIVIDYYPIQNKSADIERIFMINGKVPFAEARYITVSKIWRNAYPDGAFLVPKGETAASYLAKATEIGIKAREEQREDGTYVVYTMPEYFTADVSEAIDAQTIRFFTTDIDENEIRSTLAQDPEWSTYQFKDSNGFTFVPFEFAIGPNVDKNGNNVVTFSLEAVNEPIVISSIKLVPVEELPTYSEYRKQFEGEPEGTGKVKVEAEYFDATSSQTVYPIEDRTNAANSPSSTKRTLLNTIGGEKWQTAGQWITYKFSVDESGMYEIATKFRQNVLDGMYTSRALYIYSDNTVAEGEKGYYDGIPFEEATGMQFSYADQWQSNVLNNGETEFEFYFKEGVVYTIKLEVSLGTMGQVVNTVQTSLNSINSDYLNILKLTGTNPDDYRDYGFNRIMPDTMVDFIIQSRTLYAVSEQIQAISSGKSSMTATLERVAWLLERMGQDPENEVAKNLDQLKSYIGTLGTWLSDAKTQPLQLDYLVVQPKSEDVPAATAGFWKSLVHEVSSFIQSFFRNYDRMGAMEEISSEDAVEVWLAYGRDQSQVIRALINNDFTPHTKVPVDLKLVAGGTLLPSILSGRGPDVYIGLGQGDVINYAIRGALLPIEHYEGFDDVADDFNEAAMIVMEIEDSTGAMHTYGLPETQSFEMMFVREDILADLNIEIPRTWDDVLEAVPVLQANNMQIGMHTNYQIFLYQAGGELYADGGMRINLDSNVGLESFDTMCSFFTKYSFPYQYNFSNRFRTGEMPIGFAAYAATYNQLKVFATEIEGLWSFYPVPGYEDEEGNINNVSVSAASAIVMITDCSNEQGSWEFMKWHVGAQCQADYSNEMVAIIGPSAKHATANVEALASLPWTSAEYEQLSAQFNNLASIPNYPGSYILARYTSFAFLAAYNDGKDPVEQLQSYITTINKEITRKREEFGLETLDYVGQTLAQKRMLQAIDALEEAKASSAFKSEYDKDYNIALEVMDGGESTDFASIGAAAAALKELNAELFGSAVDYMERAVKCLKEYENYK
ncbi:MAG: extracellular solute-binding protein [Clostridia bacterium]|nr:extracellular solute-binding protein [Clostridia bacterium]